MNNIARIYRAEILRAVLGPQANELKAHDIARLNQIAESLADNEAAREALQARGYGRSGMTFIEVVREVPECAARAQEPARSILNRIFRPAPKRADGLRYSPREIADFFKIPFDDAEASNPQAAPTARR